MGRLMWTPQQYREAMVAMGSCPVENGALGALADLECPHGHLPSDKRITCRCWGPSLVLVPPLDDTWELAA